LRGRARGLHRRPRHAELGQLEVRRGELGEEDVLVRRVPPPRRAVPPGSGFRV